MTAAGIGHPGRCLLRRFQKWCLCEFCELGCNDFAQQLFKLGDSSWSELALQGCEISDPLLNEVAIPFSVSLHGCTHCLGFRASFEAQSIGHDFVIGFKYKVLQCQFRPYLYPCWPLARWMGCRHKEESIICGFIQADRVRFHHAFVGGGKPIDMCDS